MGPLPGNITASYGDNMQQLSLDQAATMLETMTITQTIDAGHAIVHVGTDESGRAVVLMNDCYGNSILSSAM